jgi:hypothetical protein
VEEYLIGFLIAAVVVLLVLLLTQAEGESLTLRALQHRHENEVRARELRYELVKMFASEMRGMTRERGELFITNLEKLILDGRTSPHEDTPRTA